MYGETGERSASLGGFELHMTLRTFGHALGQGVSVRGGGTEGEKGFNMALQHLVHESERVFSLLKRLPYIIKGYTTTNPLQTTHLQTRHTSQNKTLNP